MGWSDELKSVEGMQAALSQHGPRLATAVLTALLAVQAGFMVTGPGRSRHSGGTTGSVSGLIARGNGAAEAPPLRVADITSAHLFGEGHSAVNDANAPQTTVQLVLAGVLALPDPKRGLAIVGQSAATAKLYTVGSAVPGGVTLYAVYKDRVLLDRGGVIESLYMPRRAPLAGTVPAADSTNQGNPGQRLAALVQGNGAVLGGLVRAQAVFSGSKLTGYRIYPGSRASIGAFTNLGLRPGDLITAVNGTPLDDPNRGSEILDTLSSAASASVTVQRNGQPVDLNLNLETVASDAENLSAAPAHNGVAVGIMPRGPNRLPGSTGGAAPPGPVVAPDETDPPPAEDPADTVSSEE